MIDEEAVELTLRAQLATVAEVPESRAWSGVDFVAQATVNQMRAEYIQTTEQLISAPAAGGTLRYKGLYVVSLFFVASQGLSALRAAIAGVRAAFPNGFGWSLDCGSLHIGTPDTGAGVSTGQILPDGKGKLRCLITIPWYLTSINSTVLS